MNKKIFTLLLLAVFVLAQFSMASATAEAGADTALEPLATFHNPNDITLDWSVTGMDATGTQNLFLWARSATSTHADWDPAANFCWGPINLNTLTNANGTYVFHTDDSADGDQDVVEFMASVSDQANCAAAFADIDATDPAQASTYIDQWYVEGVMGNPPSLEYNDDNNHVSCNTFEMWSLVSDSIHNFHEYDHQAGYSGFKSWNQNTSGTFAPAPEGPDAVFLSWEYTFPSTASDPWSFWIAPEDLVGNKWGDEYFRDGVTIDVSELEDCAEFTDTAGHADETYIRYLADLGLIAGFADGTFGPDNTLTRAEAATLFEKANGLEADDVVNFPTSAPAGCEFTDVSASDWFSGWVWAACEDGFMNGIGGGLFDPNNLLTRGQVVTIFNNIHEMENGADGSYLESYSGPNSYNTMLNYALSDWDPYPLRTAAWADVSIGDYYAIPVVRAYGVGVVDSTSATTFSPNQAVLRGEFAEMLYRVLSIYL